MNLLKNVLIILSITTLLTFVGKAQAYNYENYDAELYALTEAIYFEARSEPIAGQIAVAQSILNRVNSKHYPDTIEGVVHQQKRGICQFSYYCDGKTDRMTDIVSEAEAERVALMVIHGTVPVDLTEGSDHYYSTIIAPPYWADSMEFKVQIGKHRFYRR
jgi:spore germination cell wall hydrolase CwlJ-like protein